MVKEHKKQDHCKLSLGFRAMCKVILLLSRSAVWKVDKVHYAQLHLALSHEICENKITQHLRLWHSSKSTCAGIYSSIYSQMPFLKGQKGFFFVSVDVFRCLFSLSDDESTNLAVIEGKSLQLKHSHNHFLSVVQRLCLPWFSLPFMWSCFR